MAAYCTCCGSVIPQRDEACRVCGTPRHGMTRTTLPKKSTDLEAKLPKEETNKQ